VTSRWTTWSTLAQKLALLDKPYRPGIVGYLSDYKIVVVEAHGVISGRPTLKIEVRDGAWYIAQDAPELVRRELRHPDGGIQRTDFVTFEILDATSANRKLLQIRAPRNARVVT
jgi:hypothetical protein